MDGENNWKKIDEIAIDTTETPLSGPKARIVFLKVTKVVDEESIEEVKRAVRVQLQDGRQGYVRVSYGARYFDSMNFVFHPLNGVEVVQS